MHKLMGVALLLALAGCGSAVEQAHKAVAEQLANPGSAKFTNVRTTPQGNVCGQVKGKGVDGNYGGYQSYAAIKTDSGYQAVIDRDGANIVVRAACGSPIAEPSPSAAVESAEGWDVRIADSNPGALSDMAARLVEHGFVANIVTREGRPRIFLGPFTTREEAQATRERLMSGQGIEAVVEPHPIE